jgi:hypothetical protein
MAKSKSTEVAVAAKSGLPAYLQDYAGPTGAEGIDNEDVTIPRIKLAQGTTPEVKAGDIAEGSLFLNVTGEVLAAPGETWKIIPIVQGKEFILWKDQNFEGGGVFARAKRVFDKEIGEFRYMWDKQNATFENKVKGVVKVTWETKTFVDENGMDKFGSAIPGDDDSHPAATAHHNYVVVLPEFDNTVAALSLSNTAVKKAKDFNAMLKMGNAPFFARVFTVATVAETNNDGQEYKNYSFKPAGFVEDESVFNFTKGLFESFSDKGFTVDQSDKEGGSDAATDGGKF